jgi:tetratricopeptide (TPR) repeat protein
MKTLALILACLGFDCPIAIAQTDARREIAAHFERAQTALKGNQFDAAAKEFREILRLDPASASAHANLGMIAYRQADYRQAAESFLAAVKLNPSLWDAKGFLGISYGRLGQNREAKPFLEDAFPHIQNQSLRTQVGLDLLRIAQESHALPEATSVLRELERTNPNDPEVLYTAYRVYSDLAAHALGALAQAAPDSARLHQVFAQAALTQDDVPGAIAEYRKALQLNPALPGAHFELGRAILRASQDEPARQQAQKEFETELAANPHDANSEFELGEVYALRSDLENAARHYSRALGFQPDFVEAHLARGKVLSSMERTEEALAEFREAARLDPNNDVAHYRLAQAYRKAGKQAEADREQALFQKLKNSKPQSRSVIGDKMP